MEQRSVDTVGWFGGGEEEDLTNDEFRQYSDLIYRTAGIRMPPAKKTMLVARLRKRLRATGRLTFRAYLRYLLSPEGQRDEMVAMLDAVSTNKTNFFREPQHYDQLVNQVLPDLLGRRRNGRALLPIRLWSAGCATGEEPYTLAMVLDDFAGRAGFDFSILATDLSSVALAKAQRATYEDQRVEEIPVYFRHKYMLRGIGPQKGWHRVVPALRGRVAFRRLNFMADDFGISQPQDIIFCRNVIIYFDRASQVTLFEKFYQHLAPNGYLFIGHSEALQGINGRMRRVGPALFQKKG